ncbi:MAG TPA: rhodanese-like domain-containing protein [Burkholderiales bacterium]|jgi:rhodanese-related sulfurtransferase|nr:rhodanese-like domain-containing protein [Burkholderiales bacterium]HSA70294.1 rhodanese-like domain-containing protein [Burkholderiales bacterium]
MDFVRNNLLLFVVAFVSGAMLLWPLFRRGAGGPWVNTAEATHLINREDALVLDVRDPGEFGAGHILGAKNVPLSRLGDAEVAKRKDRPVIVYCEGGERSSKAVAALKRQGFARVVNLTGGLRAWQQAGLPVEK